MIMTYLPLCNYDTSAAYVKGIYNLSAACVIITYLPPKSYDISSSATKYPNLPNNPNSHPTPTKIPLSRQIIQIPTLHLPKIPSPFIIIHIPPKIPSPAIYAK